MTKLEKFGQGLVVVGFAVLGGVVLLFTLHRARPTLDSAQDAFELSESRWNWQGWHDDGSLVCRDLEAELRSCRVFIPFRNGLYGVPQQKLAIFNCSLAGCVWVLEP